MTLEAARNSANCETLSHKVVMTTDDIFAFFPALLVDGTF